MSEIQKASVSESHNEKSFTHTVQELLLLVQSDEKLNGEDREYIDALLQKIESEELSIRTEAQNALRTELNASLKNGYTLNTPADYTTLGLTLKILYPTISTENITEDFFRTQAKIPTGQVSVSLDSDMLFVHNEFAGARMVYIPQTGKMIPYDHSILASIRHSDNPLNNNKIDFSNTLNADAQDTTDSETDISV